MFHDYHAENLSDPEIPSKDLFSSEEFKSDPLHKENLPSWTKIHLKNLEGCAKYCAGVIMSHYLIVCVQDQYIYDKHREEYDSDEDEPASLLAFNLLDHSIQEAEINGAFFKYQKDYSFIKYGENQILKYGQMNHLSFKCSLACITIKSFEPFEVTCKEIWTENGGHFSKLIAQIYEDCLYVYGRRDKGEYAKKRSKSSKNELRTLDLKNLQNWARWEVCKTTGEAPPEFLYDAPKSFLFQDDFCVYGVRDEDSEGSSDLWRLNLDSMEWRRIKQPEQYDKDKISIGGPLLATDENDDMRIGGTVYHNHFITLKRNPRSSENALCFLNLQTKVTWSSFETKGIYEHEDEDRFSISDPMACSLMSYKNLIFTLADRESDENLILAVMDLENLGIYAPKSDDVQKFGHLFMSQKKSDITFKIEGQLIPAHKKVLLKKSRYFEKVFNSGMAESKQDIIDIDDCEYGIFKEYLQFLYQEKVDLQDENKTIKLYILADKYLQEDLCEKCLIFLAYNINFENFATIMNFANERDIADIQNCCTKFMKDKLNVHEIADLVNHLLHNKGDLEHEKKLRNQVFKYVLKNFFDELNESGNMEIYQDFIIKNVEMDKISALIQFLDCYEELPENQENIFKDEEGKASFFKNDFTDQMKRRKKRIGENHFEECTAGIKEAVLSFIQENEKTIMTSEMAKCFSHGFLNELTINKKRMEPAEDENDEENHELKKTKKSDPAYEN